MSVSGQNRSEFCPRPAHRQSKIKNRRQILPSKCSAPEKLQQQRLIVLRVLDLFAVQTHHFSQFLHRCSICAKFAQAEQMKHALLDPRQILPVVDGLKCIAEQKIDRQIFVLDGKRVPEGGGRRVLTDCRVQHDPEAGASDAPYC